MELAEREVTKVGGQCPERREGQVCKARRVSNLCRPSAACALVNRGDNAGAAAAALFETWR
jgi:hypothetical protein